MSVDILKRKLVENEDLLNDFNGLMDFSNSVCNKRPRQIFECGFDGCQKKFNKPSKLSEHQRSHTGLKPFKCQECDHAFIRKSHLNAHARTHLNDNLKPFSCQICSKTFWTNQHLTRHLKVHENNFKCSHCDCSFAKQYQLRNHIAQAHSPVGTLPYICPNDNCSKSFTTKQKLNSHVKTHDSDRYLCGFPACESLFNKWTELQAHIRNDHKPVCPYEECNGKTFSDKKNLKSHLKLHDQRKSESTLDLIDESNKSIRGGIVGRDFNCTYDGCSKSFKSQKSLNVHINTCHLQLRPFACDICKKSFGHKHLLHRHLKVHEKPQYNELTEIKNESESHLPSIEDITGLKYKQRQFDCPIRKLLELDDDDSINCNFRYSRTYDLRRHLSSAHSLNLTKDELNYWLECNSF